MEEKKIATSIDILVNVDRFEHIQITKYAEKKITYESQEDMIRKEDQLTDELVKDIIRTMRAMPDKLGKKTNAVATIEEKIGKKIPSWLEEGGEPNIANTAKINAVKAMATAHANEQDKQAETISFLNDKPQEKQQKQEKPQEAKKDEKDDDKDLFGDDEDLFEIN